MNNGTGVYGGLLSESGRARVKRVKTRRVRRNMPYVGPGWAYHHPRHRRGEASLYTHFVIPHPETGRIKPTKTQPGGQRLPINPGGE